MAADETSVNSLSPDDFQRTLPARLDETFTAMRASGAAPGTPALGTFADAAAPAPERGDDAAVAPGLALGHTLPVEEQAKARERIAMLVAEPATDHAWSTGDTVSFDATDDAPSPILGDAARPA